jgi:hypothetical protein
LSMEFAQDFLAYLSSDTWASKFLTLYPYYLPSLISLKETFLHNKIAPNDFNVEIWNFYDDTFDLASFDKWIKSVYDREMTLFLDNNIYQENLFIKLRDAIICKFDKAIRFQNFSKRCE